MIVMDYPVTASLNPALRLLLFVKPVLKFRAAILVFRIVNSVVAAELSLRTDGNFERQELHWSLYRVNFIEMMKFSA